LTQHEEYPFFYESERESHPKAFLGGNGVSKEEIRGFKILVYINGPNIMTS